MVARIILLGVLLSILAQAAFCESPFATKVESYNPGPSQWSSNAQYNNPSRALGAPIGFDLLVPDNTSVVTLGDGGSITLSFDHNVLDDPNNPYGYDFIVFSNAFFVDDATVRCQELAFVEISNDKVHWYLIEPRPNPRNLIGQKGPDNYGDTGNSTTVVNNYAEYTPTLPLPNVPTRTSDQFYVVPDRQSVEGNLDLLNVDNVSGGGDAFDIKDAVVQTSPGVPAKDSHGASIKANLTYCKYIRITDAVVGDYFDMLTPTIPDEISAEIDAVADVKPAISAGKAKTLASTELAVLTDAIVTEKYTGGFYVETKNYSGSIRVSSSETYNIGDKLTLSGFVRKVNNKPELYKILSTTISTGNPLPKPIGVKPVDLKSDMLVGMNIRTWGKVMGTGDGTYFTINDGSGNIKIKSKLPSSYSVGSMLIVNGVLDKEVSGESAIFNPVISQ